MHAGIWFGWTLKELCVVQMIWKSTRGNWWNFIVKYSHQQSVDLEACVVPERCKCDLPTDSCRASDQMKRLVACIFLWSLLKQKPNGHRSTTRCRSVDGRMLNQRINGGKAQVQAWGGKTFFWHLRFLSQVYLLSNVCNQSFRDPKLHSQSFLLDRLHGWFDFILKSASLNASLNSGEANVAGCYSFWSHMCSPTPSAFVAFTLIESK